MAVTLIATPGAADANSYETVAEANIYFANRLPLKPAWVGIGDLPAQALIMGTRSLDSLAVLHKRLIRTQNSQYYLTNRAWTGAPTSSTQALAWPRTGMFDRLGREIPSNVIPQELKDALSELAGQFQKSDRTLDNDVSVQGITSIRAGSVSVSFKDGIEAKVWTDAVWNLMPPSWFTDEIMEYAYNKHAEFEVL